MLVKASAGGGGRGMRVVDALADLPAQVQAARREAESAFGDPTVFCERYLPRGHHVEVQVMADAHGTVWAVGERECSIQRRHQKIIEEAPSPLVERIPGMRDQLFEAARLAAKAIGYTGAGTVEFLADDSGEFYFLEMNTRLQVEHPVTEVTTGLDLVELQLAVADGETLPAEPPAATGHSIEARLYAEDPAKGWQPQAGTVHRFEVPAATTEFGLIAAAPGIRLDSGVVDGSVVSIFYDPMLAKVISYAPTPGARRAVLADALARTRLHGIAHQPRPAGQRAAPPGLPGRRHRHRVLRHPRPRRVGHARWPTTAAVRLSAVAAALADAAAQPRDRNGPGRAAQRMAQRGVRRSAQGPSRLPTAPSIAVAYRFTRAGLRSCRDDPGVTLVSATPDGVVLCRGGGVATAFAVARYGDASTSTPRSARSPVTAAALPRSRTPWWSRARCWRRCRVR